MKNFPTNLEEILKKSIELEEHGHKFYSESAKKIKNSLGKQMLLRLAKDETHHIERIKEIYAALADNRVEHFEPGEANPVQFDEVFGRMRSQLEEAVEELNETNVDDEEIINIALELEHHGHFFYEEAAKQATDLKVKKFYQNLAEEERVHYEVLRKTKDYLQNPAMFFGSVGL
jgi:rubrerythrin